jgi:hypothetical protein
MDLFNAHVASGELEKLNDLFSALSPSDKQQLANSANGKV